LKEDGKLLVNEQKINPMPVIIGKEKYPENIMQMLKENYKNVISLDALKIARECKNIKCWRLIKKFGLNQLRKSFLQKPLM